MERADIDERFAEIDELIGRMSRMNRFVLAREPEAAEFRADMARLLVIAIVSAYEASVRAILVDYAKRSHKVFGYYIEADCKKINARIKIDELKGWTKKFDRKIKNRFRTELKRIHRRYETKAHKDFCEAYNELVRLRHEFAHVTTSTTSIEETVQRHRVAKQVVYIFYRAFNPPKASIAHRSLKALIAERFSQKLSLSFTPAGDGRVREQNTNGYFAMPFHHRYIQTVLRS